MPVKIEGRRLNGYDLGKTMSYLRNGKDLTGEILNIEHVLNGVTVDLLLRDGTVEHPWIPNGDTATITGKPS